MAVHAPTMGNVLVAYDDTEISRKAIERAATLLADTDSMVLLYVVTDAAPAGTLGTSVCPEDLMSAEDAHLMINATAMDVVERYGVQAIGLVREGPPGPTIVDVARERRASVVVVGVGKVEKVSCFALGSVADYVARHCDVPVLIVR
jgi:nucleotide-binding universal stress UspA family protein